MSPHDTCYELIKDIVPHHKWQSYSRDLPLHYRQIPESWQLNAAMRHRLLFQIQWDFFNPDGAETLAEKKEITFLFLSNFFGSSFLVRWEAMLERLEESQREKWLFQFCKMEVLLKGLEIPAADRISWLMQFDTTQRIGKTTRARVIKTKSLGLESDILQVDKTMDWRAIKSSYRRALKEHHPDRSSSDSAASSVQMIVSEYKRLKREKEQRKTKKYF
ncbi:MAG: hypothetical protein CR997_02390 [Acidobacteria bacterium]|nr:MAG: hypothetical protein CR997_02390 [Acidobacteriota bacterium]